MTTLTDRQAGEMLLIKRKSNSVMRMQKCPLAVCNQLARAIGMLDIPAWQEDMARWTDRKEVFQSTDFKDYQPRKGFYCREYF